MAEQKATADFLNDPAADAFLDTIKKSLEERLWRIYGGFEKLQQQGYQVAAISPQAAIYLTVKIDLKGKRSADGVLETQADVTQYILSAAGIAIVPFHCFGADKESPWYRISVGTCRLEDLDDVFARLEKALAALQ